METRSSKPFGALRLLAFAATVGSAAANAAVWLIHAVFDAPKNAGSVSKVLGSITAIGGVVMGLLWAWLRFGPAIRGRTPS